MRKPSTFSGPQGTHGQRPSKSKTPITSMAELKKVLKTHTQLYFPKGAEDYGKGLKDGSRIALEKIDEFEAHWKGEADGLDDGHAKTCKCCNCFVASIYRRVLGRGS